VRNFNWGRAIGVMNYWNYFNAKPGVDPAGMLILDDVHLLEGPLRDLFTVAIGRGALYTELLRRIFARCSYYQIADDLLNEVEEPRPPEMLVFPDSAELADEVRALLDARLVDSDDPNWWAWRQIREHLQVCCWLLSRWGVTFTPYIPPSQTIQHFSAPDRRLYLSATVGSVDDLQRRLGTPPLTKLTASVQPRQGERYVAMRGEVEPLQGAALVAAVQPLLARHPKALWLCARGDTADGLESDLRQFGLPGRVWRLVSDNAVDEPFAAASAGHLVTAGRYDGMDFPDDACRVEIVPEVPVATSDLEEFVSAYLRDAPFSEQRFAQHVAQALGRCNRSRDDRAVYLLTDPEFVSRFSQRRAIVALPDDPAADVAAALERADRTFTTSLQEATEFLAGRSFEALLEPPPVGEPATATATATDEVEAFLALWREDGRVDQLCDRVAAGLAASREHRAFWFAMRALALHLAAKYGDTAAAVESRKALRAAASVGGVNSFFTRVRLAENRLSGRQAPTPVSDYDQLFAAWDRLIARYGATGQRFERWASSCSRNWVRTITTASPRRSPASAPNSSVWPPPPPRQPGRPPCAS
jgi:Helicase C-terminal domain